MRLEVEGLEASYGHLQVLRGVDLHVAEGEIVALLGPNGAGKTTLLRAISGMVAVRGRIVLDGTSLAGRATEDIARAGVAHVPEGRGTFATLTVDENLRVGAYGRRSRRGVRDDVERRLREFPALAERRRQRAGTLSGGEQQMLAIARALMLRPRALLVDEPSLGLSPRVTRELLEAVAAASAEQSTAVVIAEQNAALALRLAHRAYLLDGGAVVFAGTARDVASRATLRRSYLGY